MGLLITSYLVLTNISAATHDIRVFTAMDFWLYTCKLLIIAAIMEFAWLLKINYSTKLILPKKTTEVII